MNSSLRSGEESFIVMMLNPLVEGMREAGAAVEVVNLSISMYSLVSLSQYEP